MNKVVIEEVLEDREGFAGVSSSSPFHPDGKGGQLGDRGKIGGVPVKRVIQKKGKILHILPERIEPGEYEVEIDEARRNDIAQQHTAQHILSAAFVKIADIETVSFHMGEDFSTIDLEAAPILKEVMDEAEDLANEVVLEDRRVIEHIVSREEAQKMGLRKPLSEKVRGDVRIIEVESFDLSACGGFHVDKTGKIGLIKIIDWEKVKGSLTRVYFVAGERALKEFRKRVDLVKELSSMLTTSVDEMKARIENIVQDARRKSSLLEKVSEDYAKILSNELIQNAIQVGDVKVIPYDGYQSVGKFLFKYLVDLPETLLVVKVSGGYEIGSKALDVGDLIKKLNSLIGSKGGGGKNRGRIATEISLQKFIESLRQILKKS